MDWLAVPLYSNSLAQMDQIFMTERFHVNTARSQSHGARRTDTSWHIGS
jgi:hypothetical protein